MGVMSCTITFRNTTMKIVAVICNVAFWGFFCMVMLTDGPPKGTDILLSLIPFLMPILNVLVIRVLPSPGRVVKVVALVSNIVWLGLACWLIMDRYPSHPKEEGFIEYVALMALTPLLSAVAIYRNLKVSEPPLPKPIATSGP
jgi:hypothetical protein